MFSLEPSAAPSPGAAANHVVALAPAGPMGRTRRPHPANRVDPPYDARERDSLNQSRATGADLSRSQLAPGGAGRIFPARETAPSSSNDGYPAGNAFQPSANQTPLVRRPVPWIVVEELDHDRVRVKFKLPDLECQIGCRAAPHRLVTD
jgi:hypothetical protein